MGFIVTLKFCLNILLRSKCSGQKTDRKKIEERRRKSQNVLVMNSSSPVMVMNFSLSSSASSLSVTECRNNNDVETSVLHIYCSSGRVFKYDGTLKTQTS